MCCSWLSVRQLVCECVFVWLHLPLCLFSVVCFAHSYSVRGSRCDYNNFSVFVYVAVDAALLLFTVLWFFPIGFSHSHILHNFALHTQQQQRQRRRRQHYQNIHKTLRTRWVFFFFSVFVYSRMHCKHTSQPASRFFHNHSISWFSNGNQNRLHRAHTPALCVHLLRFGVRLLTFTDEIAPRSRNFSVSF